jgi:hypothetical protein
MKDRRKERRDGKTRRCKQLLNELGIKIGHCKLKEEALDRAMWRTRLGRGLEPVVRQTKKLMEDTAHVTLFPMINFS